MLVKHEDVNQEKHFASENKAVVEAVKSDFVRSKKITIFAGQKNQSSKKINRLQK